MAHEKGLLDGIKILDLTRALAGPYCTMMLGDLGAEVIKFEIPGRGDETRHWGPPFAEGGESAYFLCVNRNKRSVTLNLKTSEGLEVLKEFIRASDVLVENFRTGTLARMGLDYDAMQTLKPDLIYCTVTGFGYTGPYKDRPGYDFIIQAMGGLMSITGPADGEPHRVGVAIADILTGMFASNAILAALFGRDRTGKGQRIDMALLDSQVAVLTYIASNYLISGNPPVRMGNGHPNILPYQSFKARDKYFALAIGNDLQWEKFCEGVGRNEWAADERFSTNPKRVENRDTLTPMLDDLFTRRDAQEWMEICDRLGIPSAPINSVDEILAHPQVQARNLVVDVDHPTAGVIPIVGSPMNIPTSPFEVRYPPPLLGQHTEEVLTEFLGFDDAQIAKLRAANAI